MSEDLWKLRAINGPQYDLCPTYPQLLYTPKSVEVEMSLHTIYGPIVILWDSCHLLTMYFKMTIYFLVPQLSVLQESAKFRSKVMIRV